MTFDLVTLMPRRPSDEALVEALAAAAEGLHARQAGGGAVLQLHGDDDNPLVSIEDAFRVDVPGEVERLLGPEAAGRAPSPAYWMEIRARLDPVGCVVARTLAAELVTRVGGIAWSCQSVPDGVPAGRGRSE